MPTLHLHHIIDPIVLCRDWGVEFFTAAMHNSLPSTFCENHKPLPEMQLCQSKASLQFSHTNLKVREEDTQQTAQSLYCFNSSWTVERTKCLCCVHSLEDRLMFNKVICFVFLTTAVCISFLNI
ncbi:hypothetical protein DNTS_013770 [Danionella cerebrum]|uniref:Uncharacterized protein n=1 Tax=Danionella cerebrum TaxID=2873325 RepID=A0A553NIW3_9TELE|nr:hypothetical protein DNTS_013770 [Danionella translucida]